MPNKRCPYFEAGSAAIKAPGRADPIIVPTIRCHLGSVMCARLAVSVEGERLASVLVNPPARGEAPPRNGPDLRVIDDLTCTTGRLATSCTPSFARILFAQQIDATMPDPRPGAVLEIV
jgi:hypothetical protein